MCWVMPPASPAATSVSRIASSSDVLPWSTWPMIVTTGGPRTRGPRRRRRTPARRRPRRPRGRSRSSCRTRPRAARSASSVSVWVSVAISPSCISFLMISGTETLQVLGDVLDGRAGVDLDDVGLRGPSVLRRRAPCRCRAGDGRRAAAGGAAGRRRDRRRDRRDRRGRPCGGRPASRSRRGARRRRRRGRARPGARSASAGAWPPLPSALAAVAFLSPRRAWPSAWASCPRAGARRGRGCRGRPAARSCGRGGCLGLAPFGARLLLAGHRARRRRPRRRQMPSPSPRCRRVQPLHHLGEGMLYCLASSWTRFLAMCE